MSPARPSATTPDASAAFAKAGAPGVAKLYEFTDGPAKALEALTKFEEMSKAFGPKKKLFLVVLLLSTVGLLYSLLTRKFEYNGWLVGLAWSFMLLAVAVKGIVDWKRGTTAKSFPVTSVFGIFLGGVTFLAQFGDSSQSRESKDALLGYIADLQGLTSPTDAPYYALATFLLAVAVVAIPFGWVTYFRLRRVVPQPSEIYFCATILRGLLKEIAPGARCRIAFNPFPAEWSGFEGKTPSGKTAYFDSLLTARLGLGSGRTMSISVLHRRSSKGQRKHKGWKHKIKIKYCLASVSPLDIAQPELKAKDISNSIVEAAKSETDLEAPWKFRDRIDGSQNTLVKIDNNTVTLTQGFQNDCAFSSDLPVKELLHPKLVLATVRGLCTGFNAVTSQPKA